MAPMPENSLLPTPSSHAPEIPVLSISALSQLLRSFVEEAFGQIRVKGEISNLKLHASGHQYLALKDADATLDAVIWRGTRLPVTLSDGLEVLCHGRLTTYPGRSKYQMVITSVEVAGEGALLKLLGERKRKLWAEGLFAPERKKALPFLPRVIAVVTSPTGAVIRDILHRITHRFPCHVILWPVLVQGEGAAAQISTALDELNTRLPTATIPAPDVIIVARGGGSVEDLWAFNEEDVVRAVARSRIPVITAVGHETDTTLVDFAADQRAPTPTAAAEMTVPVRHDLLTTVTEWNARLLGALGVGLQRQRVALAHVVSRWPDAAKILGERQQRLDEWFERLRQSQLRWLDKQSQTAQTLGQLLESASFHRILERGFALVHKPGFGPLTSVKQIHRGDALQLFLHDGTCNVTAGTHGPSRTSTKAPPPQQMSWFDES